MINDKWKLSNLNLDNFRLEQLKNKNEDKKNFNLDLANQLEKAFKHLELEEIKANNGIPEALLLALQAIDDYKEKK